MTIKEYQERAMTTCMDSCDNFSYMSFEIMSEMGEFFGKVAKHIRKKKAIINGNFLGEDGDEGLTAEDYKAMKAELGDVMWGLAGMCHTMGWSLEEICQENLEKLADRQKRGVIDGNGDFR